MMSHHIFRPFLIFIVATYAIKAASLTRVVEKHGEQLIETFSLQFWLFVMISVFLSCFAGVCSGLTVGYMSISKAEMELWSKSDNEHERKISKPIIEILNNHHFLLSTLLLSNALALEALPIFLDKIVTPLAAVIISTAAVVIFGEVIPQAYCTGQAKVTIGYYMAPFIRFLQCILYPFVRPIVYLLDKFIEHQSGKLVLNREKLKTLLLLHNNKEYGYRPEEMEILQNILDLRTVQIVEVMIPLPNVFMLSQDQVIDALLIEKLHQCNFSKIPVYGGTREKVVGYIKVKNFFEFTLSDSMKLKESNIIAKVIKLKESQNLLEAIDRLKREKRNFAIVTNQSQTICRGIVTLKQIFQKIVLKEFKDDDIQARIQFNKYGARMYVVKEGQEQN